MPEHQANSLLFEPKIDKRHTSRERRSQSHRSWAAAKSNLAGLPKVGFDSFLLTLSHDINRQKAFRSVHLSSSTPPMTGVLQ